MFFPEAKSQGKSGNSSISSGKSGKIFFSSRCLLKWHLICLVNKGKTHFVKFVVHIIASPSQCSVVHANVLLEKFVCA